MCVFSNSWLKNHNLYTYQLHKIKAMQLIAIIAGDSTAYEFYGTVNTLNLLDIQFIDINTN